MIKIGKNISRFSKHSCRPTSKKELVITINDRISKEGNECNLNDIDTSLIYDMSWLFACTDFTGDISEWDVSHVTKMMGMFSRSKFNGDISNWDVSKVDDMSRMFQHAHFDQDISNWNIIQDCDTMYMFLGCQIKEKYKAILPKC